MRNSDETDGNDKNVTKKGDDWVEVKHEDLAVDALDDGDGEKEEATNPSLQCEKSACYGKCALILVRNVGSMFGYACKTKMYWPCVRCNVFLIVAFLSSHAKGHKYYRGSLLL